MQPNHRVCAASGVLLQPLQDRRARRPQALFGTVEIEAPWFKVHRYRLTTPMTEVTVSPVCALVDGPLHAGAGAGAGRVGRTHFVSARSMHSRSMHS